MKLHNISFPGETEEYRNARNNLLNEEIKLRRQVEEVARQRRSLPMGGKMKEDYIFEEIDANGKVKETKFSELFNNGKDTLLVYSLMYAPKNENACSSCTSIIDGINGMVFHVEDRVNFVVFSKSPIDKTMRWADRRGWKNIRLLSSFKNNYNSDYHAEGKNENQLPILNVFCKNEDGIYHFYGSELLFTPPEEGQNERHVDMIWPLWNLFDLTPEGRGTDWYPKNSYK